MKKTMKTLTLALLVLAMLSGTLAMTASAAEGYSGTPATPQIITSENYALFDLTDDDWSQYEGYYAITTAEELYGWASIKGNAILINDIVVNTGDMVAAGDAGTAPNYSWNPIENFSGTFDGRGYSISGLYVNTRIAGIFYSLSTGGVIRNLTITNSYISGSQQAGGLVWSAADGTTIENCVIGATVKVVSSDWLGGLVARPDSATLKNCVVLGTVYSKATSSRYVGAIVGNRKDPMEVSCTNCYYITGNATNAGGKVFYAMGYNQTSNDYAGRAEGIASVSAAHTCIGMAHAEVSASCSVEGSTAYSDCMVCGKILSGEKKSTGYTHRWKDATCVAPKTCILCEITEGEKNPDNHTAEPNFSINADNAEQHNKTYTDCCGVAVTGSHNFDAKGACTDGCGAQAAAKVGNEYYISVDNAIAAAQAAEGSTVKLLADATLSGLIKNGTFTLDLNGKNLQTSDSYQYAVFMESGHLTIKDSVGTGAVTANANGQNSISAYGGNITILGGSFNNVMCQNSDSELLIYGGHIDYLWYISGEVSLYGGEFVEVKGNGNKVFNFLSKDGFYYDENGALVTNVDAKNLENVTVKQGTDLSYASVTLEYAETPYTALEKKPTAVVMVLGKTVDPAYYTVAYANNTDIGTEATVTVTGKDPYSGSNSTTFEITKGSLKVETAPETTFEFGDTYVGKALTGGKVVINGNASAVITGTWAWVEGTDTATFTPDAQYVDRFEALEGAYTVTKNVTAATPVLTVTSPAPSIMPGMSIRMSVTAKNPYNVELTDLPTQFRITYKIGENGTPVTTDGLEFTLPSNVVLGETVYVWVENVAVSGKYTVATSVNTIQLTVGQVDYNEQIKALEEAIEELKNTHDADVSALEAQLETLKAQLAALDDTYATDQELADAIAEVNKTIADLADRVNVLEQTYATKEELAKAIEELEALIAAGDQASINALNQKVEELMSELAALEAAMIGYDELIYSAMAQTKAELESLIAEAKSTLETAISALEERVAQNEIDIAALRVALAEAIENLNKAIADGDAANAKALADAVAALEQALADAVAVLESADDTNRSELVALISEARVALEAALAEAVDKLEKADADNKAALEQLIADTKAALESVIAALQENLEQAVVELNAAIASGDAELAEKIANLRTALDNVIAAYQAADEAMKAELSTKIEEADAVLQAAIDKLTQDLTIAKEELNAAIASGDTELAEKIANLNTALDNVIAAYQAADEAMKAELFAKIEEADAALQAAIDKLTQDLITAKEELNAAIASGDAGLDSKIAALSSALDNAIAAYQAADAAQNTELTNKMKEAMDALDAAIKQVQKNLDDAKAELAAKDSQIELLAVIACVISGLALCGNGAFVVWFFVDRKKRT